MAARRADPPYNRNTIADMKFSPAAVLVLLLWFPWSAAVAGEADATLTQQLAAARAQAEQGDTEAAVAAYQAIIAAHPDQPEAYNNLAVLYAEQGDLESARQALEKALATNPRYQTVYDNLSRIYLALARDSYDKALQLGKPVKRVDLAALQAPSPAAPAPKVAATAPAVKPAPVGDAPASAAQADAKPSTAGPAGPASAPMPGPAPASAPVTRPASTQATSPAMLALTHSLDVLLDGVANAKPVAGTPPLLQLAEADNSPAQRNPAPVTPAAPQTSAAPKTAAEPAVGSAAQPARTGPALAAGSANQTPPSPGVAESETTASQAVQTPPVTPPVQPQIQPAPVQAPAVTQTAATQTAGAANHTEVKPVPAAETSPPPVAAPAQTPSATPAIAAKAAAATPARVQVAQAPTDEDNNGTVPATAAGTPAVAAAAASPAAGSAPATGPATTAEVAPNLAPASAKAVLQAWAAAWSARDVERYLHFYATGFIPEDGLSRAEWAAQRRQRLRGPAFIQVALSDMRVEPAGAGRVRVELVQRYRSDHYRDRTLKAFVMVDEHGQWRILSEQTLKVLAR